MTAVQSEYSLGTRDPEPEVLPTCLALDIGFVPFSPLGKGFLTESVDASTSFAADDVRTTIPRFTAENRAANQALVEHVTALAQGKDATPSQVALAWLPAQHPSIVPIPGTRRSARVEENLGAPQVPLSVGELADLNELAARVGVRRDRYNEHHMLLVDKWRPHQCNPRAGAPFAAHPSTAGSRHRDWDDYAAPSEVGPRVRRRHSDSPTLSFASPRPPKALSTRKP
ncbi:aldo/keto reductase [Streptomyces sp. NPDC001537]